MPREKESSAPEEKKNASPEKREMSFLDEEDRLGDRIADIAAEVDRSGPSELTFDALETLAGDLAPVPEEMKEEASAIDAAMSRVKNKMKSVLESGRDALRGRKMFEYEYRDAEGALLCRVKAEMGTSKKRLKLDTADGEEGRGRVLHSLILEGEKDGRHISVDALRLANKYRDPILVGTERLENSAYDSDERTVIVSSLETPFDLATLFHELGHADQSRERRFASGITELRVPTASKPDSADLSADEIEEIIDRVAAAVPEVEQVIDRDILAKIRAVDAALEDSAYEERKKLIEELRVDDIALLPKRMLERDATRRAFLWMRELRGKGIDLLGKMPAPPDGAGAKERREEGTGCEQATKLQLAEGEALADKTTQMTIREELNRSLKTYRTERARFKKPGGSGPGITPRAGGKRKI